MAEETALGAEANTNTAAQEAGAQQTSATAEATSALGEGQETGQQAQAQNQSTEANAGDQSAVDYADLKLPEGSKADDPAVASFLEVLKSSKLSKEQAQAIIDHNAKLAADYKEQQAQAEAKQLEQVHGWLHELKQDANFNTIVADANRLLNKFADPETAQMLRGTWMGSHPGIVRLLAKAGSLLKDDSFGGEGGNTGSTPKTEGERLFGKPS